MPQVWIPHRRLNFRPSGAFSPSDVTGLILWLETDWGVTSDVDGVGIWEDRSVSGNDLTQSTGDSKPDIVADHFASGIDGFQGDNSNDHMDLDSDIDLTGAFSIFSVIEYPTSNEMWFGRGPGTVSDSHGINNRLQLEIDDSGLVDVGAFGSMSANTEYLVDFHRDSSDDMSVLVNNVDTTSSGPPNMTGTHTLNVAFSGYTGHSFSDIIIGAVLIYDNKVASGDAASIRTYLNDKYTTY